MKLTSNEARTILENFRGTIQSDRWIDHCICVGDTAGKIAEALTTFETEISNFFVIDFSKTSLAKEPKYRVLNYFQINLKYDQNPIIF